MVESDANSPVPLTHFSSRTHSAYPSHAKCPTDLDSLILYIDAAIDRELLTDLEPTLSRSFPLQFTQRVYLNVREAIVQCDRAAASFDEKQPSQINAEQLLQLMLEVWLPATQQQLMQSENKSDNDSNDNTDNTNTGDQQQQYNIKFTAGLVITADDCIAPHMAFVYGLARAGMGAVVSAFRLQGEKQFLLKEVTHELGHIFGLNHCHLPCVMTFSICSNAAEQKQEKLCSHCRHLISTGKAISNKHKHGESQQRQHDGKSQQKHSSKRESKADNSSSTTAAASSTHNRKSDRGSGSSESMDRGELISDGLPEGEEHRCSEKCKQSEVTEQSSSSDDSDE